MRANSELAPGIGLSQPRHQPLRTLTKPDGSTNASRPVSFLRFVLCDSGMIPAPRACTPCQMVVNATKHADRFCCAANGVGTCLVPVVTGTVQEMLAKLRNWARLVKRDVLALYLAGRDPRVPWYAKAIALATAAYALSPIDLIPDFIPVLGYLDDLIIVPVAIVLTVRMVPAGIMAELRADAERRLASQRPVSLAGAVVIGTIWILAGLACWAIFFR